VSIMISLKDSVEIYTTPRRLFDWLERMPQEYLLWHPDHVACRIIRGSFLEVGSEIECQEYLHGKLHSMKFRVTKVIPEKRVEYAIKGIGSGAFEAFAAGDMVRFNAELDIGSNIPVAGQFFDLIFQWFFRNRIDAMKQHMAEEGLNLKAILETSIPPDSIQSRDG
jgi:hypothetical protein